MTTRLNVILKRSFNKKFRVGFIKYISSLDYKEFETLFIYYTTIIATLLIRYSFKKIKLFSKDWFKKRILDKKYEQIYNLFSDANFPFIIQFNKNLSERNRKKEKILKEIDDIKKLLNVVFSQKIVINIPMLQTDKINFLILLANSIYVEVELQRLMEELDKTK